MSLKKKILLALVIPFTFSACSNHKHSHEETVKEVHSHHNHQEVKTLNLELDNGKKWQADRAANEGIRKMQELAAVSAEGFSVKDYNNLAAKIQSEMNEIFRTCTMTGKGHDELHKVLLSATEKIKILNSQEPEKAKTALVELKETLSLYGNYFE